MTTYSDPLALKQYWNQFNGEFDNRKEIQFYDDEMRQYAMIKGIPVEYYTINVDDYKDGMDIIYGENSKPKWDRKFTLVGIIEDFTQEVRQFGGIPLQNIDEISFYMHRTMFDEIIGIRSNKAPIKTPNRRGAFGPIASDQIITPHNGLIYDVLEGGLHFLSSEAQHFGHKFWYKLTCKVREVSDATLGKGEQYGAQPDPELDDKYKGNPQFLLDSPSSSELFSHTGTINTISTTGTSGTPSCEPLEYTTEGTASGPTKLPPDDLIDVNGNVKTKYVVPGLKDNSLYKDNVEIITQENNIVNPITDHIVTPESEEGQAFGPTGRIIEHKRKELFKDWD